MAAKKAMVVAAMKQAVMVVVVKLQVRLPWLPSFIE